jgi:hypothetical protein
MELTGARTMLRKSREDTNREIAMLRKAIGGARARLKSVEELSERARLTLANQIPIWEARMQKLEAAR